MKIKQILSIILGITIANFASAQDVNNVGSCGWGSKLFDGQRGIAPQVLAVTTNGSGTQTFGITSGTSGCTQNGVVRSSWKTAMFIDQNMNKLASNIAVGSGEELEGLAVLMNISSSDTEHFKKALKDNFNTLFTSPEIDSKTLIANINQVLSSDKSLSIYKI